MPGEDEVDSVAALTHEGEGIVRAGKTVFVAGALPGERISYRRTKRRKHTMRHSSSKCSIARRIGPSPVAPISEYAAAVYCSISSRHRRSSRKSASCGRAL